MSNINTEGLQPEMQARIAEIIEKAKANAVQPYAPAAPTQPAPVAAPGLQNPGALAQRPPSLMDHIIALRGEVAELRQENLDLRQQVHASGQVTEAVGNAVGTDVSNVSTTDRTYKLQHSFPRGATVLK